MNKINEFLVGEKRKIYVSARPAEPTETFKLTSDNVISVECYDDYSDDDRTDLIISTSISDNDLIVFFDAKEEGRYTVKVKFNISGEDFIYKFGVIVKE